MCSQVKRQFQSVLFCLTMMGPRPQVKSHNLMLSEKTYINCSFGTISVAHRKERRIKPSNIYPN